MSGKTRKIACNVTNYVFKQEQQKIQTKRRISRRVFVRVGSVLVRCHCFVHRTFLHRFDPQTIVGAKADRILRVGAPQFGPQKAGRSVGAGHGPIFRGTRPPKTKEN